MRLFFDPPPRLLGIVSPNELTLPMMATLVCAGFMFMHTYAFNGDPWSHTGRAVEFLEATDDTVELVSAATRFSRPSADPARTPPRRI